MTELNCLNPYSVPGPNLSMFHIVSHLILVATPGVDITQLVFILQMRKLKQKEIK